MTELQHQAGSEEDPSGSNKALALFNTALELSPEDRANYLESACGGDQALKEEIASLVTSHDEAGEFLNQEPVPVPMVEFKPPEKLKQYQLRERIGEGSMGVVYKARDEVLERIVAIKFISPGVSQNHENAGRLRREAKALATINSPHIATVHDLIETEEIQAVVLEYVEGENLAKRLIRRPIGVNETLSIAIALSKGLKAAHEQGIVHRDLKPANVIVTPTGGVKILDFGLAKWTEAPPGDRETLAGTLMGTIGYMSPEQTRGAPATFKSDLWSLACIVYEMLTRQPAFLQATAADTIAKILEGKPSWESLPSPLPPPVIYFLSHSLEVAPESRLGDAGLAASLLEASLETLHPSIPVKTSVPNQPSRKTAIIKWSAAFGLLLCALAIIPLLNQSPTKQPTASAQPKSLPLHIPLRLGNQELLAHHGLALSPDGTQVVYRNEQGLWHRNLRVLGPDTNLSHNRTQEPIWNPNSSAVAYLEGNLLYAHSLENNSRTIIADLAGQVPPNHGGGAWLTDNRIWFNTGDEGIQEVTLHKPSTLRRILDVPDSVDNYHEASPLPEDRGLLFVTHRRREGIDTISVWTKTTNRKDVFTLPGALLGNPIYSNQGFILFSSLSPQSNMASSETWAFSFDLDRLEKTGSRFLITNKSAFSLSLSENNVLIYSLPIHNRTDQQFAWLGGSPLDARYPERGFIRDDITGFTLSPNQSNIAFYAASPTMCQLWTHHFATATSRLVKSPASLSSLNGGPLWKDNETLIFNTWGPQGTQVWLQALKPEAKPVILSRGIAMDISRDGTLLLVQGIPRWGQHSVIDLDSPTLKTRPLPESISDAWAPKFSPSKNFIAFVSGEKRRDPYIYLTDFPHGETRFIVNKNLSGSKPFWHPTEDILYFVHNDIPLDGIYSVDIEASSSIGISQPKLEIALPESTYLGTPYRPHVLAHQSEMKRFLIIDNLNPRDSEFTPGANTVLIPDWQPSSLFEQQNPLAAP